MRREIVAMHAQGVAVDRVTLGKRWGVAYAHPIVHAAEKTAATANAVHYASIVKIPKVSEDFWRRGIAVRFDPNS